jgi:predicted RNase H-like nuclease (RuvC/YqgF family)
MLTLRAYVMLTVAVAAAFLLAGCQSDAIKKCQDEKAFLDQRIKEYKEVVQMKDKTIAEYEGNISDMGARFAQQEQRIAILEKENEDLRKRVGVTVDESSRIKQGAEELRRLQQEAAARLKAQQAADPNKPR